MKLQNLSWQQVVIFVACLATVVVAYKLFGEIPAAIALLLSSTVNFLLGRQDPPQSPPWVLAGQA